MTSYCRKCRSRRFVAPPGEPDMAMPCPKCNADWKLSPRAKTPAMDEPFPFGKHAGMTYGMLLETQPWYLQWLDRQPWLSKWEAVASFIDDNREELDLL